MLNGKNAGYILAIILIETLMQALVREFRGDLNITLDWNKNTYYFVIACILSILILYILIKTYDYSNFAISNSLWNAGSIISTTIVGYYYFKESLNKYELAGMGLVIAGGILIGVKSEDKSLGNTS